MQRSNMQLGTGGRVRGCGAVAALAMSLALPRLAAAESTTGEQDHGGVQVAGVDPSTQPEPHQPDAAPPAPDSAPAPAPGAESPPPALAPSPLANESSKPPTADGGAASLNTPPPEQKSFGFEVGVRAGYGIALGNLHSSQSLGDYYSGSVPITLDGWLRLPAGFKLGLYAGLGFGIQGSALDSCDDCSLLNIRTGVQAAKHFNPGKGVDPWVSIGIGYEATSVTDYFEYAGYDLAIDAVYSGFPELTAAIGLDFGNESFAIGPFASASYAVYNKVSSTVRCVGVGCGSATDADELDSSGHSWLMFGIRSAYAR